ncbi:MAG: OB-fold nucleic acid binding domain-containing protein [Methanoregulaceae archaeon]|nr:OB-fold nucleic acid binding domain-containing protein [Methanoregulaceae archaeon]
MKIGTVRPKISILAIAVFVVFTILLLVAYYFTGSWQILIWGIPTLILLLVIPVALNYMSQSQYADLTPVYEREARPVRIKLINPGMIGDPVRIEGVVERVYFQFLNRPQYLIADRSGQISVKMFTTPAEKVSKGDVVEVLGLVMKRYVIGGDPVINCVSIRKIDKKIDTKKDDQKKT